MEKNELRNSSMILIVLAVLGLLAFLVLPWLSAEWDFSSTNPQSLTGWEMLKLTFVESNISISAITVFILLPQIGGTIWLLCGIYADKRLHKILGSIYMLLPILQHLVSPSFAEVGSWICDVLSLGCLLVSIYSDKIDGIESNSSPVVAVKQHDSIRVYDETQSTIDELGELKRLLNTNAITQEEYNKIKEKLIEKL